VNHANDSNSISSNIIQCIHEDQNQKLWIGTIMGLNLMNRETNTFTSFSTQDGLPGNSINAIQEDEEGNLWISTNNGIAKFNTQNFTSKNYTKEDGLQGNEFSSYVSCKTKEGEILFGGDNGFTIFKPQDIQDNKTLPKVVITDFKLFNQPVVINGEGSPLTQHISQTKEITLTHKQSVFSFEFVALSNVSPEKNHYAYMLEGFDDDWNEVGKKRDASYTNLNAGTYYFKVRASNNDGFLSEEGAQLKITILPPPWLSWWAYSFYVLLIIGLLLSVWLYTIKRIKEGEEHKKNEQNLRFFMNVSHEFRTPLTLILHPLNKLLSFDNPEVQAAAKTIQLSSSKLLNLVNQLLDYRRMDLGKRPLKAVKTDIVAFTKNIFTLFTGLGEVKNIKFRFVCQAPEIEVWFDVDKYEKILNNLLSNAIKFTPAGGEVEVSIAKLTSKGHTNEVEIRVKDSGIGLDAKQAKHVFERFYSDDKSKTGTGIGLNYTKSLVELHKGKIFVESTLSVGSTFIVRLPLGASHLKKRKSDDEVFNLDNFQHQMHQLDALKYDIQTTDEEDVHISEGEESTNRRKSKKPLLLIVEDNKKLRTQLREQLARTYTVSEAINGLKGWEMALKTIPDLIISDVMMPEMDGIELCQKLKNTSRTSHIPVILLTAQSTDSHKIQGYDSGADQYISKPFNYEVLESRIKSLLIQRKRLHNIFRKQIEVTPSDITATTIDEQMIQKALDFVEKHISNSELSVEDLSAELQVTRGHLYRKLMSITGKSPSDFIRSIRLKRAAQLLRSSRLTVSEIAYKVGFSNPKYFSKCFKVEFDLTPSKYASKKHED